MGGAMLQGFGRCGMTEPVYVKTRTEKPELLQAAADGKIILLHDFENAPLLHDALIICAIKPKIVADVLKEASNYLNALHNPLLISVVAGLEIEFFKKRASKNVKIARLMPNTPVAVGRGLLSAYIPDDFSVNEKQDVIAAFSALGAVIELAKEADISPATALAGSGPAYLFHFVEALAKAGEKTGLSADLAYIAAKETVIGAAQLMQEKPDLSARILREQVTSPNGTTQAGLEILMNQSLNPETSALTDLLTGVLQSASERSRAIASEFEEKTG